MVQCAVKYEADDQSDDYEALKSQPGVKNHGLFLSKIHRRVLSADPPGSVESAW